MKYKFLLTFELIQDIYNESVLYEVQEYLDNLGKIKIHKTQKSVSLFIYSTVEMKEKIIPKLFINYNDLEKMEGPIIKLYKFKNFIKVYNLLQEHKLKDPLVFEKILRLSYDSFTNPKEKTFEEYKNRFKL